MCQSVADIRVLAALIQPDAGGVGPFSARPGSRTLQPRSAGAVDRLAEQRQHRARARHRPLGGDLRHDLGVGSRSVADPVRGEQRDGLLVGGDVRPRPAPPGRRRARPAGSAKAARGEPHPVKPVGVLGVRGLRGATRLAAAAHALERSFSVLAGVASVKVTRAVTRADAAAVLDQRLERRPGARRDDVAAHREDDAADHQPGDDGPEGAIDAAGDAVARDRRGDRARDGREDGRPVLPGRTELLAPPEPPPVPPPSPGRPLPVVPGAQCAAVIVSLIRVTLPLRASARPCTVTPLFSEIDVRARMLPTKADVVPKRRGAADLPEDVARLGAVDEVHVARRRGDQRRGGLEDEHGVGVALGVERERPGEAERRRRLVDAGREREAAEVGGQQRRRRAPGGVVVGGGEVRLRLERDGVGRVDRPVHGAGREARDRRPGLTPRSPLIVVGPVLVTVCPARTA